MNSSRNSSSGSDRSRRDLQEIPPAVRRSFGVALFAVQLGENPPDAKPLKGFGGAGVLELIEDHRGSTSRAVYTVRFATRIYVLHAFQKKSKRGIATPQARPRAHPRAPEWAERLHTGKV